MAMNPKNRSLDKNGNPIVTKEELAKSGMTLRAFLNKERGLTARPDPTPPNVRMRIPSDADLRRASLETLKSADARDAGAARSKALRERAQLEAAARAGKDMSPAARNMENYKPRRSGSPLAPKTTTPSKPAESMPDWASRHAKKSN